MGWLAAVEGEKGLGPLPLTYFPISHLLYVMLGYRWDDDLPELPDRLVPGLHVEVVAVHPVVEHLRRTPLDVETVVARAGQVGDQRPGRNHESVFLLQIQRFGHQCCIELYYNFININPTFALDQGSPNSQCLGYFRQDLIIC